jgi:predicted metal-dependent hydrolase
MIIYIIIIVLIILVFIIFKLEKHEVKYVKSRVNNVEYLVRDTSDKQEAADRLGLIEVNIKKFIDYVYSNKDNEDYVKNKEYIEQLHNRIKNVVISESSADSSYTSYSVNKGEQLVFCLRSKYTNSLHDLNLLMYVVLHELSHVGCPEYGHGPLFKKIFAFFAECGIKCDVYKKIEFNKYPKEYCGLMISESII